MYDEDLIEDSLAFCRELKSFFDDNSDNSSGKPESKTEDEKQPESAQSGLQNPVQSPQPISRPQSRPMKSVQQADRQPQQCPVQSPQPTSQSQPRPMKSVQQAERQPQQRPAQSAQPASQPQPRSMKSVQQAERQPQQRPVKSVQQAGHPQPQQRPAQPVHRPQPQQRPVQPAQFISNPAAGQKNARQQSIQQASGAQIRQQQPLPADRPLSANRRVEPFRQNKNTALPNQPKNLNLADEAISKLRQAREAQKSAEEEVGQEAQEQKKKSSTVRVPIGKGLLHGEEEAKEAEAIQELPEDGKHTYEITIKFDFANIKRLFYKLKEKLTPEERTLEDVNAAMEENRQRKQNESGQNWQSPKELQKDAGAEEAGSASGAAKMKNRAGSLLGKIPFRKEDEDSSEDIAAVLEGYGRTAGEGEAAEPAPAEKRHFLFRRRSKASGKQTRVSRLTQNVVILIFCVGIAYFCATFFTNFVAHQTTVEGESMEPTLSDGDSVIIQKVSYYFREPKRYDVIVFPVSYGQMEEDEDTYYIKRVIGLPGETVQILDGSVYINGEPLQDDKYALSDILDSGAASNPVELADDEYFVMGDNRNMSTDSRSSYVGLVNRADILGEAWLCIWPLNHFGTLTR